MTDALFVGPEGNPDRYELGAPFDAGAEGILYRGTVLTSAGARLNVAIKMLHPKFQARIDDWRDRWVEQVELLRSLQTPGVVTVRDGFIGAAPHAEGAAASTTGRSLYLVMNWVDGVSLEEWTRENADKRPSDKLRMLLGVAAALDVMHSGVSTGGMPVIHGDIKPSNILVTPNDSTVLVDFGLMRIIPDGVHESNVSGTTGYMAPEVLSHGIHSPASDRYSLGGVAYFLLTGSDPADHTSQDELRRNLAEAVPGEPELVDNVILMMSTEPAERPTDLANWCAQLRNSSLSAGFPTGVIPPIAPPRVTPASAVEPTAVRRSRRGAIVAAALVLALVGVAGAAIAWPRSDSPKEKSTKLAAKNESTTTVVDEASSTGDATFTEGTVGQASTKSGGSNKTGDVIGSVENPSAEKEFGSDTTPTTNRSGSSPTTPTTVQQQQQAPTTAPTTAAPVVTKKGNVNGCNTYGQQCDGNPIFNSVPQSYSAYQSASKIETVNNGKQLTARCWTTGTVVWNYAALHDPVDYGPNPYDSTIYFNVQASNGSWGYIPDTYFVRDKQSKMGLPHC